MGEVRLELMCLQTQSGHQVRSGGGGNEGLAEPNHHMRDEHEVRDGVTGEGQELSQEDESKINEVAEDIEGGGGGDVAPLEPEPALQKQKPQPLGLVIRWERFLPIRSLKVLLVENDDSTRQLVSALLRNCSYEVIAAANGLQAWNILEDLTNHVDLVLTEVVMPCLSGIGLLSKIMSHKTCKNIPVIMMSSIDSMGIVFKCLSKGAVDFLVKPIRKNELKNLWQHVWRRCHSSSDSVSESGIQNQKSTKSKSADDSDNNTGSNDEDENGSVSLNLRDGSDNGSGTQSSWTKRAVEIDSPQPLSPSNQLADPHDSTCAQVIYPKPEKFCNQWVPMTTSKGCQDKELANDDFMGKDLEIGMPKPDFQHGPYPAEKVSNNQTGVSAEKLHENNQKKDKNDGGLEVESSNASEEPTNKAVDLIGGISNNTGTQLVVRVADTPNGFSNISECEDKTVEGPKMLPSLELSLKRLRSTGEEATATHDDRNVLRHSGLSAFTRYNTSAASNQVPTGCGASCSIPLDKSSEALKMESTYNTISESGAAPLKQGSNGSSNDNDMGSTTKNVFAKPPMRKDKMSGASAVKCIHPSAFSPLQHQTSGTQQVTQEKINDVTTASVPGQPRSVQQQVQVQHHHHHYHHHHHHVHSTQQQHQQAPDHDALSLENMAAAAPQCGSSNVFTGPMDGIAVNYSINGSASGINHASNGQNGSTTAVNTGVMNMESDTGVAGRSEARGGTGNGSGSGSGLASSHFTPREAALNKFRQKRKERNFGKKVRYQSRKRLAEQRPRVRGQFVRQNMYEHASQEGDS